jgi:hypothetical protein
MPPLESRQLVRRATTSVFIVRLLWSAGARKAPSDARASAGVAVRTKALAVSTKRTTREGRLVAASGIQTTLLESRVLAGEKRTRGASALALGSVREQ